MEKLKNENKEELIRFAEQKKSIRRLWNIDESTADLIMMLILIKKPKRILEIGTSNGYSCFMMSLASEQADTIIDTIEVEEKRYNMAKDNIGHITSIHQYFGKAESIIPNLNYRYDFVFIDANKSCYHEYLQLIIPLLEDESIIIADNVQSHQETTIKYREFLKTDQRFISILVDINSGLLISKYKK